MATVLDVLRTSPHYLLFLFVLCVFHAVHGDTISVVSAECIGYQCLYTVRVPTGSSWRLTPAAGSPGDLCLVFLQDYDIREQPSEPGNGEVTMEVAVPIPTGRLYFCRYEAERAPLEGRWLHQGTTVALAVVGSSVSEQSLSEASQNSVGLNTQTLVTLNANQIVEENLINKENWVDLSHDIDVNNEPGAPRPTRAEANDILVLSGRKGQYVRLSEVNVNLEDKLNSANAYTVGEISGFPGQESVGKKQGVREVLEQDSAYIDLIETGDVVRKKRDAPVSLGTEKYSEDGTTTTITEAVSSPYLEPMSSNNNIKAEPRREDNLGKSVRQAQVANNPKIKGIRIEHSQKSPENEDGIPSVLSLTPVTVRVFGSEFTKNTYISFQTEGAKHGEPCIYRMKGEYVATSVGIDGETAEFAFVAPEPLVSNKFYFCILDAPGGLSDNPSFVHQGTDAWVTLMTHNKTLPLWATLLLILVCLMFSALFSGLNLGLMSLDRTELKIIANTGTEQEKKYARTIQPVRDHGNYLLCSILLGNVAVNSTFTILLDDLMSGLFAVIFSTLAIVCLGEIVPQAICSRHGLMISAKTIVITKAAMGVTAPLAYPVSKLLDYFLGEEIGNVYNRERLKELVKVTNDLNDLDKDEVNIISGALEMRKKTVSEVMTKIEDVFMLSSDSVLDFETMSEIVKSGFSRIPVYDGTRNNIVTVLFIKDLAFVDPDDNTPLKTLCQFYQNSCNFVFEDTTLDVMFRQFKEGHKGHMAFVQRVNNEGEGDPFYETIGLVTLEDVIEEMIQAEIVDETDVFTDNRSKRRRNRPQDKVQDFAAFAERRENQRIRISPQLTLATFQFLSSTVDAFRPDVISETVLKRLLRQDIIHQIKCKGKDKKDPSTLVYTQGKPVDYFVLLLEGRVEVTVGRENLVFEAGAFTYFGVQALTQNIGVATESPTPSAMGSLQNINMDAMLRYTFVPDYSVRAVSEVLYIVIKRSLYLAAKRATLMEKTSTLTRGGVSAGEQFDNEVDKLLQSLDEDVSLGGDQRTPPSRQISPSQPPASANPQTRSSFTSTAGLPALPAPLPAVPAQPATGGNGDVTYKFPPGQQIETDDK